MLGVNENCTPEKHLSCGTYGNRQPPRIVPEIGENHEHQGGPLGGDKPAIPHMGGKSRLTASCKGGSCEDTLAIPRKGRGENRENHELQRRFLKRLLKSLQGDDLAIPQKGGRGGVYVTPIRGAPISSAD